MLVKPKKVFGLTPIRFLRWSTEGAKNLSILNLKRKRSLAIGLTLRAQRVITATADTIKTPSREGHAQKKKGSPAGSAEAEPPLYQGAKQPE
jgi:hypothetical protein